MKPGTVMTLLVLLIFVLSACTPDAAQQTVSPAPEPTNTPADAAVAEPTTAAEPSGTATRQVIIDTDMAVDDWFAILYALQRPDVQVLAITVAGTGEAHCDPGVQNAASLVALAGNAPIPVDCGDELPLAGSNTFPDGWRSWVDSMAGVSLPGGSNPASGEGALALMVSVLESAAEPVDVLALGPLTNVAGLVSSRPDLNARINRIVIMGGAVHAAGNLGENVPGNSQAEWNIYVDPLAASIVFDSGIPVLLVGLDATNQAQLNREFYDRFSAAAATPESEFVLDVLNSMQSFVDSGGWYFWDPMAAAVLVDETLAGYEMLSLDVVEEPGDMQGAILISESGPQVQVAVTADRERFIEAFIDTMNQ